MSEAKMTPQEAIKILEVNSICSPQATQFNNAVVLAKAALEKQIPKKPNLEGDGYDENGALIYDTGYCPNCNQDYEVYYHAPKHCENCGQALNWGDTK